MLPSVKIITQMLQTQYTMLHCFCQSFPTLPTILEHFQAFILHFLVVLCVYDSLLRSFIIYLFHPDLFFLSFLPSKIINKI